MFTLINRHHFSGDKNWYVLTNPSKDNPYKRLGVAICSPLGWYGEMVTPRIICGFGFFFNKAFREWGKSANIPKNSISSFLSTLHTNINLGERKK